MVINLNWVIIELAFVLATALLGFMIGWKYMAIWTVGVFFSTIVASKIGPRLVLLLEQDAVGGRAVARHRHETAARPR